MKYYFHISPAIGAYKDGLHGMNHL